MCGFGGWQESLDFSYDAIYFILIGQGNHEKLVAFVETDNTVGEQPDAAEKRIAAHQPAYWRAHDASGLKNLRKHRRTRCTTNSSQ